MLFTITDVILIVVITAFTMLGFFMGLISAIGALVGLVVATWAASNYFMLLAEWLNPYVLNHEGIAKTVSFLVIFFLVNRLVAILFWVVNKIFGLVSIIPFLKSINRLGGAILGFVEGVIITGTAIFVTMKFVTDIAWLSENLDASRVAHWLVWTTQFLSNFIP